MRGASEPALRRAERRAAAKSIKVYRFFARRAFNQMRIASHTFHKEYRFNQSSA